MLPIAALFGVVKSSGTIGVDEKYVLVPKNDKPAGDMRRWIRDFDPYAARPAELLMDLDDVVSAPPAAGTLGE